LSIKFGWMYFESYSFLKAVMRQIHRIVILKLLWALNDLSNSRVSGNSLGSQQSFGSLTNLVPQRNPLSSRHDSIPSLSKPFLGHQKLRSPFILGSVYRDMKKYSHFWLYSGSSKPHAGWIFLHQRS
jgi:hypothetical protein